MAYPFAQFDTRTPPAAEGYVPSFLSKLPFIRRSSKGTTGGYRKPPANQHVLETLEPRVLLAADLSFGAATDLTLQYDSLASEYQLIDDLSNVVSQITAGTVDGGDGVIDIDGSAGDDTLGLDWATLLGGKNINFTGLGTDTLSVLSDSDMNLTSTQLTVNGLGYTVSGFDAARLTGGAGDNILDASGFSGNVRLEGAGGHDTLIGGSGDDVLIGGGGHDVLFGGSGTDSLAGGLGSDTVRGADKANAWRISAGNQGNVDGVAFSEVENLIGGNSADIFSFDDGAGITGTVTGGGGADELDYATRTTGVNVNLGTATASDTGGFADIESITGGLGTDTLTGADDANIWNLTGTHTGVVGGVSFSGLENLEGGALDDTFALADGASIGTVTGGGGTDTLDYSTRTTGVNVNLGTAAASDTAGFSGIESVTGGLGTDTLTGADSTNTWIIDGSGAGNVSGTTFTGMEHLEGGALDDTFQLTLTGGLTGSISGGAGNDTLIASDSDNVWEITGADQGTLNTLVFVDIENLTGGAGDDLFRFLNGGSISGTIDGAGGINTLDYSSQVAGVAVNLETGSATGLSNFTGINKVTGSSGADTLRGLDASNVWTLSGLDTGSVGSTDFSDIENLEGGSVADTFVVQVGGGLTGTLSGGLGFDELFGADGLNTWTVDAGDSGTLNALPFYDIESLVGGTNEDEFLFAVAGFISGHFTGGPGLDRVRGANQQNTWRIKGSNSGKLNDRDFSGIENIEGGSDADDFILEALGSISGTLTGGAGSDTLDYSETSAGVTIDLSNGTATGTGGISSIENVISSAGNDTIIGALSAVLLDTGAGTDTLDFSNVLSNLNITVHAAGTLSVTDGVDSVNNIAGAENIIGGTATNTYTFEDGASITGTITGGSNVLSYAAYTTNVSINLNTNTATGTGGASSVVNVIGGAGSDTLTGADSANTWNVTGTNTGSVGGTSFSGVENLAGGTGADSFTFAALSSVDSVAGNAGSDTLDLSSDTSGVTVDLSLGTASYAGAISGIEDVVTGAGNDTIIGALSAVLLDTGAGTDTLDFSNVASNLNITVHVDGTTSVTDGVDTVNNIAGAENIIGGTGTNTYTFEDGASIAGNITGGSNILNYSAYTTNVSINLNTNTAMGTGGASSVVNVIGGTGNDTLTGADNANAWSITGVNTGTVGSTSFSGIENLAGGTGADSFTFAALSSVDSVTGGDGSDTLDLSSDTTGVTVDLSAGTASYAGTISDIENVVTGAGNDTIIGALSAVLLDTGAGTDTLDFSNVASNLDITVHSDSTTSVTDGVDSVNNIAGAENVVGGTGTNTYTFENGASLAGNITGGSNVLDHSQNTTGISVNLNTNTTTGVTGTVSNIVNVIGGAGNDTLTGADSANTWNVTGLNSGSVGGTSFSGVENLAGGTGADSFTFAALSSVDSVAGNAGSDTLNLSSDTTGVTVDLSTGTASYAGAISDIEDVVTGSPVTTRSSER